MGRGKRKLTDEPSESVYSLILHRPSKSQKSADGVKRIVKNNNSADGDATDADSKSKYYSRPVVSPSPTPSYTSISVVSRESDSWSVSTSSLPNVEPFAQNGYVSQTSPASTRQPSAERSINDVLLSTTTSQSNPPMNPKNAKYQFYRLLKENKVSNSKHYDALLNTSAHLRQLEEVLNPNLLQTCKRIGFNQNLQYDKQSYLERIADFPDLEELKHRDQSTKLEIALITAFLTIVSSSNKFSLEELCYNIVSIINQDWHKVRTLLCIGTSDTGKSMLANLITNVFEPYEHGIIAPPTSNQLSDFWLQDLVGKSVYRCEELTIEFKGVLQRMKQLMEGNKELDTPIKFGDNKSLKPRPLIVTMNGDHPSDIVGPYHEEFDAVQNRCIILLMKTTLSSYIPKKFISILANSKVTFHSFLYYYYKKHKNSLVPEENNDIEDFIDLWL